ncbi:MAG: hypothetical protein WC551_10745 [Patescibacteria group bacterium]
MMTNKEKYDALYAQFEIKLRGLLPRLPEKYYAISVNYTKHKQGYFIEERTISKVDIRGVPGWYKKVTKIDIERLRIFIDTLVEPKQKDIFLHWTIGNTSAADTLEKVNEGKDCAWQREHLEKRLAELIELYSPREGYIRCSYCRKQRKPEDIIYDTIISPNWKNSGYKSPPRPYCKDSPCAGYDQMGHEG